MNLLEGEYIEQIEEVGDGWWSGVGPGGKSGLFPCKSAGFVLCFGGADVSFEANYVELVEHTDVPVEEEAPPSPPPPPPPPPPVVVSAQDGK